MAEFSLAGKYPFLMDEAFKNLSPELQKQVFAGETAGVETRELGNILREMRDPEFMRQQLKVASEFMRQQLKVASEFDKERMKEAGKYKMLFDLPDKIIQAATLPGQIAAEGTRGIAASMMQAGQQIPNLVNYQRSGFSYTPTRYF
jgi:hypothetical protein